MVDLRRRGRRALLQAGVTLVVDENVIARADEGGDGAVSCRPPRRIEGDVLRLEQRRDMLLQLQRQPRVAEQHPRPGAVRTELPHGVDAGGSDGWMSGEPEIVLRREVDAVACRCGKVGNG